MMYLEGVGTRTIKTHREAAILMGIAFSTAVVAITVRAATMYSILMVVGTITTRMCFQEGIITATAIFSTKTEE